MDYFHFKFHQNRTRFSTVFLNFFIHSLWILMCLYWISDHLTSTFKTYIIQKRFRAGHWFFQWCLMILKSNFSKNFSTLGEFSKDLWAKEVTVRFFFAIVKAKIAFTQFAKGALGRDQITFISFNCEEKFYHWFIDHISTWINKHAKISYKQIGTKNRKEERQTSRLANR